MQCSHTTTEDLEESEMFYSDYYDEWSDQWDFDDEDAVLIINNHIEEHFTTVLKVEFEETKLTRSEQVAKNDTSAIMWQLN